MKYYIVYQILALILLFEITYLLPKHYSLQKMIDSHLIKTDLYENCL